VVGKEEKEYFMRERAAEGGGKLRVLARRSLACDTERCVEGVLTSGGTM